MMNHKGYARTLRPTFSRELWLS